MTFRSFLKELMKCVRPVYFIGPFLVAPCLSNEVFCIYCYISLLWGFSKVECMESLV